jgi:hypothetical protein
MFSAASVSDETLNGRESVENPDSRSIKLSACPETKGKKKKRRRRRMMN